MANNKKKPEGHAYFEDGMSFQEIAQHLHETGEEPKLLRLTTIRSRYIKAMYKLAEPIAEFSGRSVKEIGRDPDFQKALAAILSKQSSEDELKLD
jgi:hypothetical protein